MTIDFTIRFRLFLLLITAGLLIAGCDQQISDSGGENGFFPRSNLENAKEYALKPNGDSALILWYQDQLILEEYTGQLNRSTKHTLFSGTKSLAGMLAALAVRDNLFTFDTLLSELIEGWDPQSKRGNITVRELLNLTSGLETAPAGQFIGQSPGLWRNLQMAHEKGTTFAYGPTPFYILAMIMIDNFAINPVEYLNENLFQPLGLTEPDWIFSFGSQNEIPNLSFGALYPAFDWVQLGILLSKGGTLDGISIIPSEILSELFIPSNAAPNYGITFWLNTPSGTAGQNSGRTISSELPPDAFMKSGLFGQRLYIIPSMELVIARFGPAGDLSYNDREFFRRLLHEMTI